ncbi:MAG: helix-turn-helix domain-containing protein [Lachnospiraceae bacterium]|nr:helix-turn-helix domain-containing protein [Lachnospiraceae bacterium]
MFTDKEQLALGKRIRKIRKESDESQLEFAEKVSISSNFLSEIENGKKGLSCENLYNICESAKISADYLLFGDKDRNDFSNTVVSVAPKLEVRELEVLTEYLNSVLKMKKTKIRV